MSLSNRCDNKSSKKTTKTATLKINSPLNEKHCILLLKTGEMFKFCETGGFYEEFVVVGDGYDNKLLRIRAEFRGDQSPGLLQWPYW
jgi:hypothetical protein